MLRKSIVIFLVLLGLYTFAGFFALPYLLKPIIEKKASAALARSVEINGIDINPFLLTVRVKGVKVLDKHGTGIFFSLDELFADVQARSAVKRALIIREASIRKPSVGIARFDKSTYSFSDLMQKKKPEQSEPGKPFHFSLGNIRVTDGSAEFRDMPARALHRATGINLAIPFVSNIDEFVDVFVEPEFSANINGTAFTLKGRSKPFIDSLETSLDIDLKGISVPFYLGYLPPSIMPDISSGTLDMSSTVSYIQHRGRKPYLSVSGDIALRDLTLLDKAGKRFVSLPETRIALAPSPLMERSLIFSRIEFASPGVFLSRDKAGRLNIAGIMPGKPSGKGEKGPGMAVAIRELCLKKGTFGYTDTAKESPVRLALDEVSMTARDVSTTGGPSFVELSSRLNRTCVIGASGRLEPDPLSLDARLDIEGFRPGWVQPYFTDTVRIMVTRGSISVHGDVRVEKDKASGLKAGFAGNALLADFASVDRASADNLIRCKSISLEKLRSGINPGHLEIGTVRLTGLCSNIIVHPDGRLNLATIAAQKEGVPSAAPARKKKPAFEKIAIRRVVVENSRVSFTDKSVKGGFSAHAGKIEGTVRNLSSDPKARADVNISGMLNGTSPLLIKGTINPFRDNFFVNLHACLTGIDLSPMSPYSGKYVGYRIEKGKLSLDLDYLIRNKDLDSQNNVFIDRLTFGEQVESDRATKFPVRFAVALLKDSHDRIDLNLPVRGRTDDPKFSVLRTVVKIVTNLIVKAATSPFLLLDALYPGASELSFIEFAYGKTALPEACGQKMATLQKVLAEKPSLNLEVRGYADPEKDREGLEDYLFEKKLKLRKLADLVKKGNQVASADDIAIAPEEYELYLKRAYKEERFPKPRNMIGMPLSLAGPEMEKLIRQHIVIGESDMRLLAQGRAQAVKDRLVTVYKIDPARVFLIETNAVSPGQRADVKSARVDLALK